MVQAIITQSLRNDLEAGFRAAMTARLREQCSSSDEDLTALASSNDLLFDEALEWATSTINQEASLTPTYLMISLAAGYAVKLSLDDHPEQTLLGKARALLPLLELMNAVPIDVYTLVCEVWFADKGSDDFRRGVRPSNCSDRQEGVAILVARPGARECRHYRTLRVEMTSRSNSLGQ